MSRPGTLRRAVAAALVALLVCSWASPVAVQAQGWRDAYSKGLEHMAAKRWAEAVVAFDQAIKDNPRESKFVRTYGMQGFGYYPHREKGVALYHLRQWDAAIQALEESIRQGSTDDAVKYVDLARKRQPVPDIGRVWLGTWADYYDRGLLYGESGLWRQALDDFRAALKARGSEQTSARTYGMGIVEYFPLRELGIALYHDGQYQAAVQALERSVANIPTAKGAYYLNLARAAMFRQSAPDRNPPRIKIDEPPRGLVTNRSELDVRGSAESNNFIGAVDVNGDPLLIEAAAVRTPFDRVVRLASGPQDIVVAAKDLAGNQSRATVSVLVDREGPVIEIDQIERTPTGVVRVNGTLQDNVRLGALVINAQTVALTGATDSPFSIDLPAQTSEVLIEATDAIGNSTRARIAVPAQSRRSFRAPWPDVIPAQLPFLTPASLGIELADAVPAVVKQDMISVSWRVLVASDPIAAVKVNNESKTLPQRVQLHKPLIFSHNVPLAQGENVVTIAASDRSGRTASKTVKVTRQVDEFKQIGSRLSVAVFPFARKGKTSDTFEGAYEGLVNVLLNQGRFKVVSRVELDRILKEQKISQSELADPATALRVGKLVAAEAILVGTVKETATSVELYAQLINTQTSTVMVSKDAYDEERSPSSFRQKLLELAEKIRQDYPMVEGLVISIDKQRVVVGVGSRNLARMEMKMIVYEEGQPIVDPQSKAIIDRLTDLLGEGALVEVRPQVSFISIAGNELKTIERQINQKKTLKVISK